MAFMIQVERFKMNNRERDGGFEGGIERGDVAQVECEVLGCEDCFCVGWAFVVVVRVRVVVRVGVVGYGYGYGERGRRGVRTRIC